MTSNHLYSDYANLLTLMKEDIKRRYWCIALSILGNLFALVVLLALYMNMWTERLRRGMTTLQDVRLDYFHHVLSCGNIAVLLLILGIALVNGIQGTMYLHSRVKSDLYDSLPVKRTKLFSASYLNGILIFAIPYIAMHMICVFIGLARGYYVPAGFFWGVLSIAAILVFYTAIYSLVVLGSLLCGNTVVAIMAGVTLNLIGVIAVATLNFNQMVFFTTYYDGLLSRGIPEAVTYISPASAMFELFSLAGKQIQKGLLSFDSRSYKYIIEYLIVSVLLYILCRCLITIRPSETAGRAIAFRGLKPVVKVVLMIPAALMGGLLFYEIASQQLGWYAFGLIAGVVLVHAVLEIIYEFDFKACFKHLGSLGVGAVLTVLASLAFILDPFGYDSYIPETYRISSAALASTGLQNGLDYSYDEDLLIEYGYMNNNDYRLMNMELTDIEPVLDIVKEGVRYAKATRLLRLINPGLTEEDEDIMNGRLRDKGIAVPDPETGYTPAYSMVIVCYRLTGGREVYREYTVNFKDEAMLAAMEKIYNTDEYKAAVFPELAAETEEFGELYYDAPNLNGQWTIEPEKKKALIAAYKEDLKEQSFAVLSGEYPIGMLGSQVFIEEYRYYEPQYNMYIYPSFERTIALLKEDGFDPTKLYDSETVVEAEVYYYNEDENSGADFTKKEEIKELMESVIFEPYLRMNPMFAPYEEEGTGYYGVSVYYSTNPEESGGSARNNFLCVDYTFRPNEIPEFVKKAIEENLERDEEAFDGVIMDAVG
ncbi:MAG: hypothetical protein IJ873_02160 [Lachnospiraceae bacterium]|nr:hypothetical protein [Lachnospiraceae bacterium]